MKRMIGAVMLITIFCVLGVDLMAAEETAKKEKKPKVDLHRVRCKYI